MKQGIFILLVLGFIACKKEEEPGPVPAYPDPGAVPEGFPQMEYPADNPFSYEKWVLGKKLFYDPMLSEDYSISCGSCHQARYAFADPKKVSIGAGKAQGIRNSPSLANVGYHPYFTREGGVPTLEMQVLVPIQEHNEFNFNMLSIAERMKEDEEYVRMSHEVFGRDPDAYVITRSIATFERTLISGNSAYDRYKFRGEEAALTPGQLRGMQLFFSDRANCGKCHSGFNFTDYSFRNNGLYDTYADAGRYRLTLDSADLALFKVPSLRNVALSAPYMHDGSMETLREVVEHYNSGGQNHRHKSEWIHELGLTPREKEDLVQFLESLTDPVFITNPVFHDQ